MYPKKIKEFETSHIEIFMDFKDFIKFINKIKFQYYNTN